MEALPDRSALLIFSEAFDSQNWRDAGVKTVHDFFKAASIEAVLD